MKRIAVEFLRKEDTIERNMQHCACDDVEEMYTDTQRISINPQDFSEEEITALRVRASGGTIVDNFPEWAVAYVEECVDNPHAEEAGLVEEWKAAWPENACFSFGTDSGFSWNPEFGLACDCVRCYVTYPGKYK